MSLTMVSNVLAVVDELEVEAVEVMSLEVVVVLEDAVDGVLAAEVVVAAEAADAVEPVEDDPVELAVVVVEPD